MHRLTSFRCATLTLGFLALAACTDKPNDAAFLNRGTPESLLDVSSEVVNLSTANNAELNELSNWIDKDQPTRAELHCAGTTKRCSEAQKVLELHGVPTMMGANGTEDSVTLVYERILARDCKQQYQENGENDYNAPHPAFGCSVAANIVQSVTDKQEFVSPNLSDDPLASRAVNDMYRAYQPRNVAQPYDINTSIVSKAKTE